MTLSDETQAQLKLMTGRLVDLQNQIDALRAQQLPLMQDMALLIEGMEGNATPAPRVLFASPVTGKVGDVFGGAWFAAVNYAEKYGASNQYHTGVDLNLPGYADAGKPVYCAADGEIVYSAAVPGWQGLVVIVKHTLEDGSLIWTRYAHIRETRGLGPVKRGESIGTIADYTPLNNPAGDHLHYDISRKDLGAHPDDWPGTSLARVLADYVSPAKWHTDRGA